MPGRIIPVNAYPPMLSKTLASRALLELRSERLKRQATEILASNRENLRAAVLELVQQMEEAAHIGDTELVYAQAHEIRGMAATGGIAPAGVIANGLCRYVEAAVRAKAEADPSLIELHVEAVARAARSSADGAALGGEVAQELALLVQKKLGEIKD
jgi:hypothetical protein